MDNRVIFALSDNIYIISAIVLAVLLLAGLIWLLQKKLALIRFTIVNKHLNKTQRKTLKKHFAFYKKLSPELKEAFEKRLIHFLYEKKYRTDSGEAVKTKKKLLIAAYAAQLTMGIEHYSFHKIKTITIYPAQFIGSNGEKCTWEVLSTGEIKISWNDFFKELNPKPGYIPVGIKVMAYAMKLEGLSPIKEQLILHRTSELFRQAAPSVYTRDHVFKHPQHYNRDEFVVNCLINYFGNPVSLKNSYPEIFRRLEKCLYSGL
ncbi:MAG: zinc-dependent peptidase [Cytophagaceae bacterium]|nr:zinc-dependent peptidase [Cytophagaceae bacterium]MDW8456993.1 zinc-dependent peptidase [Cytophagaceae bacterium]